MRKHHLIFLLTFLTLCICGQVNLVLNPSFETHTACPSGSGNDVAKAIGWDTCRSSPDYFNTCSTIPLFQVPINYFGKQVPINGEAYCGLYTYSSSSFYRELIIGQLTAPLVLTQKYFISLKVNRADSNNVVGYSSNKIGIKFTKVKQKYVPINNIAHFYSNSIITDTVNWTKISGSFVADSAYNYLMLGNFFDDANTSTFNHGNGVIAYYYIDEVCVSTDSLYAENYVTSIKELFNDEHSVIYPNPANQFLNLKKEDDEVVRIYNCYGAEVFKDYIDQNNYTINCSSWPNGMYLIRSKKIHYKIIINH